MLVHDAVMAFRHEHGRPPARVYVSPLLEVKLTATVTDVPMDRPLNVIGLDVMGTDWYVDHALSGEMFRLEA